MNLPRLSAISWLALCAVTTAALVADPTSALAQRSDPEAKPQAEPPVDPRAEALRLYKIGLLQFEGEEFEKAAESFTEALRLDRDAILAYNAARAFEKSGDLERARALYVEQLDLSPEGDLGLRAAGAIERIDALLSERRARAAEVARDIGFIEVRTDSGGEVLIDGVLAGGAPGRFEVPAGRHALELRRKGARGQIREVEVRAGQTITALILLDDDARPLDLRAASGFGMMGGGVLLGAIALGLDEPGEHGGGAVALGLSALAVEAAGAGLLLWSLLADEGADRVLKNME